MHSKYSGCCFGSTAVWNGHEKSLFNNVSRMILNKRRKIVVESVEHRSSYRHAWESLDVLDRRVDFFFRFDWVVPDTVDEVVSSSEGASDEPLALCIDVAFAESDGSSSGSDASLWIDFVFRLALPRERCLVFEDGCDGEPPFACERVEFVGDWRALAERDVWRPMDYNETNDRTVQSKYIREQKMKLFHVHRFLTCLLVVWALLAPFDGETESSFSAQSTHNHLPCGCCLAFFRQSSWNNLGHCSQRFNGCSPLFPQTKQRFSPFVFPIHM